MDSFTGLQAAVMDVLGGVVLESETELTTLIADLKRALIEVIEDSSEQAS